MTIERMIARLLTIGTYAGVAALSVGVVLMLIEGVSPTGPTYPPLDVAALPGDLLAFRPAGWLWLGLIVLLSTPIARVAAALVRFLADGEQAMVRISAAILVVIAVAVVLGAAGG
jgi:uncharacterized membrane protein